MAEELGTALVEIQAPLDRLKADLAKIEAYVRKELDEGAELKIDADARAALTKIDGVSAEVRDLPDGDVMIDGDAAAALAAVDSIESGLAGIEDETVAIMGEPGDALGAVSEVGAGLAGLGDESVVITADAAAALAAVDSIESGLAGIEDETVAIMGEPGDALGAVGEVGAGLAGLGDESVVITADAQEANAEVLSVQSALAAIQNRTVALNADPTAAKSEIDGLKRVLKSIENEAVRVGADTGEAQAEIQALKQQLDSISDRTVIANFQSNGLDSMQSGLVGAQVASGGLTEKLKGTVAGVGALKAGVAGLAGGAAVGGFYSLGQGALELRDTVNATNVVFGDSRRIIDDWATNSVDRVGLSERAFRDLSAPLGALMRSLGATGNEVANMSTEVISLGADFASVLGGSTEEAVMAIGAAFRGETEPIRRYGITLDAAAVQERALAMGLVDATGEIKNRAAVMRDLIVEQAAANGIVGDFNRTQGEGVNALREAGAALDDAKNAWGELFAPAVEAGANALRNAAEASEYVIGPLQKVHGWLDKIDIIDLGHVLGALRTVGEAIGIVGDDTEAAAAQTRLASEAQRDLATASRQGADGLGMYYNSLRTAEEAQRMNSEAQRDAAAATRSYGYEAEAAERATSDLQTALDELIGVHLSAESAQIRFEQALHTVTSSLQENTHHLDSNSTEALQARSDVVALGEAALRTAESMTTEGARVADVSAQLETNRQRMLDHMVQGGMTRAEAETFVGTLGFTKENLDRVAAALGAETAQLDAAAGATANAKGRTDELKGSLDRSAGAASTARDRFFGFEGAVRAVPGSKEVHVRTPGLHEAHVSLDAFKAKIDALKGGHVNFSLKLTQEHLARGDGPGAPVGGGGPALARVQRAMAGIPGLRVTSTYRSPAANARAGGAANSYHMDRLNPAVDIGGPTRSLDMLAARLRSMGGWREGPIWRAPGHTDHVHVAHEGGMVSSLWPRTPGLRADERMSILQVGEVVIPKMHTGGVVGSPMLGAANFVHRSVRAAEKMSDVHNHFYGSVIAERDLHRTLAGQQGRRNYVAGRR